MIARPDNGKLVILKTSVATKIPAMQQDKRHVKPSKVLGRGARWRMKPAILFWGLMPLVKTQVTRTGYRVFVIWLAI